MDSYGTVPYSVSDDPRFDDDAGQDRAFFFVIMLFADDWGRFDGSAKAFGRRVNMEQSYVDERLKALEGRGVVQFYEILQGRVVRRVGEVIGFHDFAGHTERKAFPAKRGGSEFPNRDGTLMESRRGRDEAKKAAKEPKPDAKLETSKPATSAPKTGKKRGSDVEETRNGRDKDVSEGGSQTPQKPTFGRGEALVDLRGVAVQNVHENDPSGDGQQSGRDGLWKERGSDVPARGHDKGRGGEDRLGKGEVRTNPAFSGDSYLSTVESTKFSDARDGSLSLGSEAADGVGDWEGQFVGTAPAFMPAELAALRGPNEPYVEPFVMAQREPSETPEAKARRELAEAALAKAEDEARERRAAKIQEQLARFTAEHDAELAERAAREASSPEVV